MLSETRGYILFRAINNGDEATKKTTGPANTEARMAFRAEEVDTKGTSKELLPFKKHYCLKRTLVLRTIVDLKKNTNWNDSIEISYIPTLGLPSH